MKKLAAILVAVAGCATPRGALVDVEAPTREPVRIGFAERDPGADQLAEAFYAGALPLDELDRRAAAALAAKPASGTAHEVAGYLAMLRGDRHRAWWHFLRAAASFEGPTELHLQDLSWMTTRDEEDATLPVVREIAARHPRAEARAMAAYLAAGIERRQDRAEQARALTAPLGFLREWLVVGPFDNDQGKGFLTAQPPETSIDPAAELPGRLIPVGWRKIDRVSDFGAVELEDVLYPTDFSAAYLATWVHSDAARPAELRLTTSSALRVWVNDDLVASEEQLEDGSLDGVRVSLTLARGWNKILVKSANRGSRKWYLAARFTDGNGAPLALSATAEPHAPAAHGAGAVQVSYLPGSVAEVTPPARKQLVSARLLALAGRSRDALAAIQDVAGEHPENLIAIYYSALLYWDNDQLGKAIDLLDQGVKATGSRSAAFLIKRARYYAQKRLYDRAQRDLSAALGLGETQYDAAIELADIYRQRGWPVEQCRALDAIARKWPDSSRALDELAGCLDARELDERAGEVYQRADKLEPGDGWALRRLVGFAMRRGHLALAESLVRRERALWPTSPTLVLDLGELARRRGDSREADQRYREAAAMCPGWERPHELIGDLAFEAGKKDDALAEWRLALERDPNRATLAQRIEQLAPTRLGAIEAYVPTDEEIDRAINAKVTAAAGAQMIYRLDHEVTEINADGGARRVVTQVIEAVNDHGRDGLTKMTLPGSGQLKILQTYALSTRGERQEASSIRGSEIRFRNLEIGSKVVVQYVHYALPEHFLPNHFASSWSFQGVTTQHEDARWVVLLKKGRPLNIQIAGEVAHQVGSDGELAVHRFSAAHVPPLVQEVLMPPVGDVLRRVHISTVPSWDEYVRWERALLDDALHADRHLDELAAKLTKNAKTPREKLDQLYHYVTQDIRYQQDYETTIAGVRPHAPTAVLERGYGDCKDKALLLIQLARRVGVQARFAILRTTTAGRIEREVPNQQFNHAIVYVPAQPQFAQPFFLDPTSNDLDMGALRGDDQGATSLVVDLDSGRWEFVEIPFRPSAENLERHRVTIQVKSPTEASSVDQILATGSIGMVLRRVLHNRGMARKLLEGMVGALFSGATLVDMTPSDDEDIWKPVGLKLDLDFSNALRAQGDHWRFTPPGMFPLSQAVGVQHRETPLWFGEPSAIEYRVDVALPAGYQVTRMPGDLAEKHKCFTISRKSHGEGREAAVQLDYERTCPSVTVAEYTEFRDAVQRVTRQFQDEVEFAKAAAPAPAAPAGKPRRR